VGGDEKGDTVEIVSSTNDKGRFRVGFWFGSDPSLHGALSLMHPNEQRRVITSTPWKPPPTLFEIPTPARRILTKRTLTDAVGM